MAAPTDDIFMQAMAFFPAGNLREAEKSFRKLLRKQPSHPLALSVLGAILTGMGQYAEAERLLRSAVGLNPGRAGRAVQSWPRSRRWAAPVRR